MSRRFAALRILGSLAVLTAAGCVRTQPALPANVSVGSSVRDALPHPQSAAPDAPPRILALHFSSLDVHVGGTWTGKIVTTTNVASVEIRTNLFSIDVPRSAYGTFGFSLDALDVPPIFLRGYALRVIARNAGGAAVEEDLPLRFR